ncbi:hypothetical protein [Hellea balneolensis]|uniref:hypothetical protein n=1 Tax=Hellea balneolensis TaxID=287478 RepID=UPI00047AA5BF|nr:hypothetical protein [Hellea balneolensis]
MSKAKLAFRETAAPTVALVTSLSTLICCTLPAVMITLGMGAALSSLTSNVPQLIWLSERKPLVFGGSFILLCLAWWVRYLTRNMPCPADPAQAKACARLRALGGWVLYIGFGVWAVGAFSAFVLPKLLA